MRGGDVPMDNVIPCLMYVVFTLRSIKFGSTSSVVPMMTITMAITVCIVPVYLLPFCDIMIIHRNRQRLTVSHTDTVCDKRLTWANTCIKTITSWFLLKLVINLFTPFHFGINIPKVGNLPVQLYQVVNARFLYFMLLPGKSGGIYNLALDILITN